MKFPGLLTSSSPASLSSLDDFEIGSSFCPCTRLGKRASECVGGCPLLETQNVWAANGEIGDACR